MDREQDNQVRKNESLLDIARDYMESSKRAKTLKEIGTKAFGIKGLEVNDDNKAQFELDCMISGYFVCVGESSKGEKLWDLKGHQSVAQLDKEGNFLNEDPYSNDEDVIKHELKDDYIYGDDIDKHLEDNDDDEDESKPETDDIAEELGLTEETIDDETGEVRSGTEEVVVEKDDDDDDEKDDEDDDDIIQGTIKNGDDDH